MRRTFLAAAVVVASLLATAGLRAQTAPDRGEVVDLEQNFPNPFAPRASPTIFTFTVPDDAHVKLTVYNLLGQEVAVLLDERRPRGRHRVAWDGTGKTGEQVPPGPYWYKLEAGEKSALKRLRVLREPDEE